MVKFREASPGAAYLIADGVTDAEEAAKLGLIPVESALDGSVAAYGKYGALEDEQPAKGK